MSSQDTGGSKSDPWAGWQGQQAHPNSPSGGGGPGRFKSAGSLGTTSGAWHGIPHPLAPGARYLAVADAYCELGSFPNVRIEERGGVYYVSLTASAAMRPFLRTDFWRFSSTVKGFAAASKLAVIVNGNQYKLSHPMGIVRGRDQELAGVSEPERFHVAWTEGPLGGYAFGKGDPPAETTAAVGGLGPVILGGLKFGAVNRYRKGVPAGAPPRGEPGMEFKPFLEVRGNLHYESFTGLGASLGKVVIGYGKGSQPLRIVVQPHGVTDLSLDEIRDNLFNEGVENAVFLDGSDSAMLFANGRFYVQQGFAKNWTNAVGIGFQAPCCYVDPPGRSLGNIA